MGLQPIERDWANLDETALYDIYVSEGDMEPTITGAWMTGTNDADSAWLASPGERAKEFWAKDWVLRRAA